MTARYSNFDDVAKALQPPDKGILSRTLFNDDRLKAVIFGFAQGEELSEHTASTPAVLHFLQGEAKLTLGDDTLDAKPGTWVHMPTGLRHGSQVNAVHEFVDAASRDERDREPKDAVRPPRPCFRRVRFLTGRGDHFLDRRRYRS
jgi:quercetin dioxygenase-like cupin family protein